MLNCHPETLRIRVRRQELRAERGPHGRYYVTLEDLAELRRPRRFRRRRLRPADLEDSWRYLHSVLEGQGFSAGLLEFAASVSQEPALDIHLYRLLAVYALYFGGLTTAESADLLGITSRQVRYLKRADVLVALRRSLERKRRAERGTFRLKARTLVKDLQDRLQAAGFQAARRDRRRIDSGARDGLTARLALVRRLDHPTVRALLANGLDEDQVEAIKLLGIGADELNELILRGLPSVSKDDA